MEGGWVDMGATDTGIVIISVSLILLIWEFYVLYKGRETISQRVYQWSKVNMIVPFIAGLLCGHFFW